MNNTILITGTSSGIGRASAKKFQRSGWNVIATMRTPEKEVELKQLDHVLVERLDVQDQKSITTAVTSGINKFGQIDVVLNNAGYALLGTFESAPKEHVQRQYEVNVFGLFDVTRAVLPHFRKNGTGTFINVSSVGGKMTFPLTSLYHSTKFAIEGFSESAHYEWAPLGIKVKIIEPGGTDTDFGGRSMDFQHDESLQAYNDYVAHNMEAYQNVMDPEKMNTPAQIAEEVFVAATDGTNQLRYRAGADAEQLLTARETMSDEDFFGMMRSQFNFK
jgi:NAD(P)-dependent dehydrogenase (short-subunit alcohol dehydrogenase family)